MKAVPSAAMCELPQAHPRLRDADGTTVLIQRRENHRLCRQPNVFTAVKRKQPIRGEGEWLRMKNLKVEVVRYNPETDTARCWCFL